MSSICLVSLCPQRSRSGMKANAKSHPVLQHHRTFTSSAVRCVEKKGSTSSFVPSFWYANEERGSPSKPGGHRFDHSRHQRSRRPTWRKQSDVWKISTIQFNFLCTCETICCFLSRFIILRFIWRRFRMFIQEKKLHWYKKTSLDSNLNCFIGPNVTKHTIAEALC